MSWLKFIVAALLVVGLCATSECADPLKRPTPERMPEFRSVVSEADYSARAAKALEALAQAREQAAGHWPTAGVRLLKVEPNSPAASLGMKVGDVIVRFGDLKVWNPQIVPRFRHREFTCEFFSAESGQLRTVTIPPGAMGVQFGWYWRPELVYLRGKSTKPKWDEDVFVAITSASRDADLAETAWNRALAKGYSVDGHAAASGTEICLSQGRTELAWDFAYFASRADQDGEIEVHPVLLFRAAVANYQLNELRRIAVAHRQAVGLSPEEVQGLIDLHQGRSAAEREMAPPSEKAASMYRDNLIPRLMAVRPGPNQPDLGELLHKRSMTSAASIAHFQKDVFVPVEPTPNVDLSFRFTWQPEPGDAQGFLKQFTVNLLMAPDFNPSSEEFDFRPFAVGWGMGERALSLMLGPMATEVDYQDPGVQSGGDASHAIHIVKVGGQAEVFLDDRRLLYLPVEEDAAQAVLTLKSVGSKTVLTEFEFVELVEKR
jgi:hypothetical protein